MGDAWWPAGNQEWDVRDIGPGFKGGTTWIEPRSLDAKLRELLVSRRTEDPGHELVGKTGEASHRCQSRIPRACKFMAHCRDLPNCSFCHHEACRLRWTDSSECRGLKVKPSAGPNPLRSSW
ncbi:unnamed protein product [Effrenium voratum]|nr:unnamed protein product [Effrenium voratum]